jgi:hypothetical protein
VRIIPQVSVVVREFEGALFLVLAHVSANKDIIRHPRRIEGIKIISSRRYLAKPDVREREHNRSRLILVTPS